MTDLRYSQIFPESGKFQFVELGPGKGTLLSDILHTWNSLGISHDRLHQIHLVERSGLMREAQAHALGVCKKSHNDYEWGKSTKYNVDVFWHDEVKRIPRGIIFLVISRSIYSLYGT